jgi:FMN reductase
MTTTPSSEPSTRRISVVSAGLSQPSSTRLLADRLSDATVRALADRGIRAEVVVHELRDTATDVTNNLLAGFASPALQAVLDDVASADGLIAVSPIFTTSYSGMFKSFIDILDTEALIDMPVLLGATGGSERHSLALDYAMRPLFTYLHAAPMTTAVFAASSDWGSTGTGLADRIGRAAGEFAVAVAASDRSSRVRDPFALPPGFSPVGAFGAQ